MPSALQTLDATHSTACNMTLFIGSEDQDQLIPLLGCEYFDGFDPSGLTIKQDGRMYICYLRDTLIVREIDGSQSKLSQSKLSLRPCPNKEFIDGVYYARVCSDDGIVVHDESYNVSKFTKDGEFIWRIKCDTTSPIRCFCIDSSDLLYCATSDQVKVYLRSGTFSHDMVIFSTLKHPNAIAIDEDNNVHVGVSSIQVFSTKGKLIHEYGHNKLCDIESIAISRDNPQLVVAIGYDPTQLFVFNNTGSFLYSVTGVVECIDSTFGPDNSLWIAEQIDEGDLVRVPKLFCQLPPPLSYLCELSILPHLNELPVSLLPPRLNGLFEKWTRLVTVEVRHKSFTDYPSKSKLLSEMIELKVEPDAPLDMVRWLVEKKVKLKPSIITISQGEDKGVDFVVND